VTINAPTTAIPGGALDIKAAGVATLTRPVTLGGARIPDGGELGVVAASVVVGAGAVITGDASTAAGRMCLSATGGDLHLGGQFLARGGSVAPGAIQGMATGDVIADGVFQAAPSGCLAFTAGGTVDTAQGSFDRPLSADCGLLPVCTRVAGL
jgi:hypothetical protein